MQDRGYRLVTVDVEKPVADIPFERAAGIGVILRRGRRLVGFVPERANGRERLTAGELSALILREAGEAIVMDRLRVERARPSEDRLPSVTVAICTRARPSSLDRCLASIARLSPGPDACAAGFEVLVVDNAPPDGSTRDVVAAHPGVRYTCEPKPGLNFGRNRAVAEASGEIIAFVDDDVVVDSGWLGGLREAWLSHPDAKAFTGLVLPLALDTEAQVLFELRGGFRRGFRPKRFQAVDPGSRLAPFGAGSFGAGANMAFDRRLLLDLGGFDDALDTGRPLPGGGDLDIFYRAARTGHPFIYEPQFAVFHEHRRELKQLRHQYWTWGLAHMAFVVRECRCEPESRRMFGKLIRWWFKDQVKQLGSSLLGRHVLPPRMVAAELVGGIVGLAGEYERSRRRIERIRRAHP